MNTTTLPPQLTLNINLTDEEFFQLCQNNRDLRFERTAAGELIIMPPTGSDTGNRNFDIAVELGIWNKQTKLGKGFDSSTGFKLSNGKDVSPDVAWIKKERWHSLTPEQQNKFAPIAPDFVIELRSASDNLKLLQEKMQEYIENGVKLAWLIDRKKRQVFIYRPNCEVEQLDNPQTLTGEDILPGFVLDISEIW
ncbi:Uma2 family endonuclease [Dolichospermum circinale CS-1225]|uniref:Uma2 family endonuclease n=2 Tax=Dolichospermum TaxID=748770 RepID=A0ABT5A1I8_9CYAN|nr:Uma2 family endonuclease [Dolichospermum circinale]MDB9468413.1 Uma2 family endonuclease [Dolichospermum circinale CS-539/09]MDB9472974.1 Uma2 family endonuclease [Dolichospermum circinale CS-539]MDB9485799.1 Uma2 family endonuclease [Dolichospermum circinale CS-537/01]MDB9524141.1 Uma2 family endonuclease [Dolichospermum circinale CS-1225]